MPRVLPKTATRKCVVLGALDLEGRTTMGTIWLRATVIGSIRPVPQIA